MVIILQLTWRESYIVKKKQNAKQYVGPRVSLYNMVQFLFNESFLLFIDLNIVSFLVQICGRSRKRHVKINGESAL